MRLLVGLGLIIMSCRSIAAVPMVNYKGDRFNEISCERGNSCSKSFTSEAGQNVTVVVNCTTCDKDKKVKKFPQKKLPIKKAQDICPIQKPIEKIVTKEIEKVIEKKVEVPVKVERVVRFQKKNTLSLMIAYGEGGVINYLQTGNTPHNGDYILEREHGVMIGPMYQRHFDNATVGAMVLSSGHVGLTLGFDW